MTDKQKMVYFLNIFIFISDEHILLCHEISLHFTQTNIIGALEVGLMIDLDKFNPVAYTLLDDVAEDEK